MERKRCLCESVVACDAQVVQNGRAMEGIHIHIHSWLRREQSRMFGTLEWKDVVDGWILLDYDDSSRFEWQYANTSSVRCQALRAQCMALDGEFVSLT